MKQHRMKHVIVAFFVLQGALFATIMQSFTNKDSFSNWTMTNASANIDVPSVILGYFEDFAYSNGTFVTTNWYQHGASATITNGVLYAPSVELYPNRLFSETSRTMILRHYDKHPGFYPICTTNAALSSDGVLSYYYISGSSILKMQVMPYDASAPFFQLSGYGTESGTFNTTKYTIDGTLHSVYHNGVFKGSGQMPNIAYGSDSQFMIGDNDQSGISDDSYIFDYVHCIDTNEGSITSPILNATAVLGSNARIYNVRVNGETEDSEGAVFYRYYARNDAGNTNIRLFEDTITYFDQVGSNLQIFIEIETTSIFNNVIPTIQSLDIEYNFLEVDSWYVSSMFADTNRFKLTVAFKSEAGVDAVSGDYGIWLMEEGGAIESANNIKPYTLANRDGTSNVVFEIDTEAYIAARSESLTSGRYSIGISNITADEGALSLNEVYECVGAIIVKKAETKATFADVAILPPVLQGTSGTTKVYVDVGTLTQTVSVVIYDKYGSLTKELADSVSASDILTLEWDGTDTGGSRVRSGNYICVIQYGTTRIVKQIYVVN